MTPAQQAAPAPVSNLAAGIDAPLSAQILNGAVVISIGANVLAKAIEQSDHFWDGRTDEHLLTVTDPLLFAKEVLLKMESEDEEGYSPITRLFDKCAVDAIEWGAEGCELRDPAGEQ